MKKVSVIYWSSGGNVELLASYIAEGAKAMDADVELKHVNDASIQDIINADGIALGSPAMMDDKIEQLEMKPFIDSLVNINFNNKPLILFGSCGWRNEEFITNWQETMEDYGFKVIGRVVSQESLNTREVKLARQLGEKISKM